MYNRRLLSLVHNTKQMHMSIIRIIIIIITIISTLCPTAKLWLWKQVTERLSTYYNLLYSLVQSFILNLIPRSLTNTFLHRTLPDRPDWLHGLSDHIMFFHAQWLDLFAWCDRLCQLSVGFRTHLKSTYFHSFIHWYASPRIPIWTIHHSIAIHCC